MNSWRSCTVSDLVEEGIIAPPMDGNHGETHPKGGDFIQSGIPFVMASDINGGFINFSECKFISRKQADGLRKGFSVEGDVLLSHKATIGRTAIVPKTQFPYIMLTPQVTYYRVLNKEKLNNQFLKYQFDNVTFKKTLELWAGAGSTRAYIGITNQKNLPIKIPTIETQNGIAEALASIDKKIALNNKINTELEAMAKLIYDYWFVQFDFPDANGKPYKSSGGKMVYNEALKREIPEGWGDGKLRDIIELNYGKPLKKENRSGKGFPVVGSGGIVGFHEAALVKGPGIAIGRKGTVGSITYLDDDFYPIDTSYYVVFKSEGSLPYIAFLLRTLGLNTMNSDSAVPGLNRDRALGVDVVLAPAKVVEKFCQFSGSIFTKKANCNRQNQELSELRDWLLPMLMNGQVTVKDTAP